MNTNQNNQNNEFYTNNMNEMFKEFNTNNQHFEFNVNSNNMNDMFNTFNTNNQHFEFNVNLINMNDMFKAFNSFILKNNQMNKFNTNKAFVFGPNNANKNNSSIKISVLSNYTSNLKNWNRKQKKIEDFENSEDIENYIKLNPNYAYTDFQKQSLARHNKYRREHHVDELKLSNELCEITQKYADYLVANDEFEHSDCKFKKQDMEKNCIHVQGLNQMEIQQ